MRSTDTQTDDSEFLLRSWIDAHFCYGGNNAGKALPHAHVG